MASHLACNGNLAYVDLSMNGIGDEGVSYIAKALQSNTNLIILSMARTGITDKG